MKYKSQDVPITPVFVAPGYQPITSIKRFICNKYPVSPDVLEAVAKRLLEFQPDEPTITHLMVSRILSTIRHACPEWVNKADADALIAEAAYSLRHDMLTPTASQYYELERYADFLPEAYAARVAWHTVGRDKWWRQRAAKRGAETRRRNRNKLTKGAQS